MTQADCSLWAYERRRYRQVEQKELIDLSFPSMLWLVHWACVSPTIRRGYQYKESSGQTKPGTSTADRFTSTGATLPFSPGWGHCPRLSLFHHRPVFLSSSVSHSHPPKLSVTATHKSQIQHVFCQLVLLPNLPRSPRSPLLLNTQNTACQQTVTLSVYIFPQN